MTRFFNWLYAKRRNYLIATTLAYFVPMYLLVLLLKEESSWTVNAVFLLFTLAGAVVFSTGMWFLSGRNAVERVRRSHNRGY